MQNYEIIRKLGQGSYGSVYLARQRDSGRQCVMKRMVLRSLNSKERESAFQEARVLRDLSHPNIVAYIDTQATASKLYLFMQFCDGGDLEQRLAKLKETEGGAVTQPQALDWFVQMALALQYLHSRRILHRDLKTANVFLTRRDIVKLGDFGVSRVLSATAELARTFVGTPYYLSPELLNNQPYGQPSDVWALGCIFHEIATLEHPYEAKTFPSLAFKIINEDVRPLASYPAAHGMEPELQRLVDLMLTKEHTQRATLAQVLNEGVVQRRMLAFVQEAEAAHPRDNPPSTPSRAAAAAAAATADATAATTAAAAAAAAAATTATTASIAPTQRAAPLPARPAQPAPAPALAPRPTCASAPAPAAPGRPLSRPASASTPAAAQAAAAQAAQAEVPQAEVPPAAPTPHKRGSNRKAAAAAAAAAGGARGAGARGGYARQAEPRRPEDLRAEIALEQQRLQRIKAPPAVTVPTVVQPAAAAAAGEAPALQVDAALQAAQAQAETLRSAAAPALISDASASAAPGAAACTRSLAQWTECFGDALQPPLAGSAGAGAAAPLAKTAGWEAGYDEEAEEEYAHYTPYRTPLHALARPCTPSHTLAHPCTPLHSLRYEEAVEADTC